MMKGGLTELARLLGECLDTAGKVDENLNKNFSANKGYNSQPRSSFVNGPRDRILKLNSSQSFVTIYESAVKKVNLSSSEDKMVNTSGESEGDRAMDFINTLQNVRHMTQGQESPVVVNN